MDENFKTLVRIGKLILLFLATVVALSVGIAYTMGMIFDRGLSGVSF